MTKTRKYLSLKMNLDLVVNFWREKDRSIINTSSENVSHYKWFDGILWCSGSQSGWQILEINKTIDLWHSDLEMGIASILII